MERTFSASGPIAITVHQVAGSVHLDLVEDTGDTGRSVTVSVHHARAPGWLGELVNTVADRRPNGGGHDAAEAVLVRYRDGPAHRGSLVVDTRRAARGWRTPLNVHITAPAHSAATISAQSADIDITGPARRLATRTSSGNLRADAIAGPARVSSASGDIVIASMAGDLAARTVSGIIAIGEAQAGRLRLTTVSGDVDLAVRPGCLASVNFTSVSGEVRSDLPVNGQRRTAARGNDRAGHHAPGPHHTSLDIAVRTVSGDIALHRHGVILGG